MPPSCSSGGIVLPPSSGGGGGRRAAVALLGRHRLPAVGRSGIDRLAAVDTATTGAPTVGAAAPADTAVRYGVRAGAVAATVRAPDRRRQRPGREAATRLVAGGGIGADETVAPETCSQGLLEAQRGSGQLPPGLVHGAPAETFTQIGASFAKQQAP